MDLTQQMNRNLKHVSASPILSFSDLANSIPGSVKFTLGEPDFNTPEHIKQAAVASIQANHSHYAPSNGTPGLKSAISHFLANKYDQHYDPDQIIVTCGATEAIYTTVTSVLNPGDKVIVPTPTFPMYMATVAVAGGEVVPVNTAANNFKLSPDLLQSALQQAGDRVKLLILNYPGNPTGVTYTQAELDALADVLRDRPIFVMCDEIYSELVYNDPQKHPSLAHSLPEQTIVINGVSKSHAMTGWRIGFMCACPAIIQELGKIHQFTITSAATMTQDAAEAALKDGPDDALPMRAEYQERRDFIIQKLADMDFQCAQPDGAFYVFAKIPADLNQNDDEFAHDLLKANKVALIPGSYFGPGGAGYLRLSYATSMAEIEHGMQLMHEYVQNQRNQNSN